MLSLLSYLSRVQEEQEQEQEQEQEEGRARRRRQRKALPKMLSRLMMW